MGFFSAIWEAICDFFEFVVDLVCEVISGILDFATAVLGWFKQRLLQKGVHTPFIANMASPQFKEMLHKAPTRNVGIFEGVYNEQTEEREDGRTVEADSLDYETRRTLGNE